MRLIPFFAGTWPTALAVGLNFIFDTFREWSTFFRGLKIDFVERRASTVERRQSSVDILPQKSAAMVFFCLKLEAIDL